MKVSVIMPVYNAEKYLNEAIDSILNQTYKDFELILINDGSTDGSEEIIRKYNDERIKLYNNEKNLGLIATLNKGLTFVTGKYIARQDADDVSLPNRFEIQVNHLEESPDTVLISSNAIFINEISEITGESDLPQNDVDLRFRLLFKCGIFHTSTMFRQSSIMLQNLQYNSAYPHSEDYKLWSDLSKLGKIYTLKEKLVKYRKHSESVSNKHKAIQEKVASKIVRENIWSLGVEVSEDEAVRLRALFRTIGVERKYLLHDMHLFLKIIKAFDLKYKHSSDYDVSELVNLLRRMRRWISKTQLLKYKYLVTYLNIQQSLIRFSRHSKL